jgi:hypothetical protein
MLIVEPCDTTEKIVLLREQVETMLEDLVDVSNSVGYLLSKFTTFLLKFVIPPEITLASAQCRFSNCQIRVRLLPPLSLSRSMPFQMTSAGLPF